jgi:ankyrin repeat protein
MSDSKEKIIDLLKLVGGGADLTVRNTEGKTALILACQNSLQLVALAIVECPGADINANDNDRKTPLMYACQNGLLHVALAIVECPGADIDSKDNDGMTPLMHACSRNDDILLPVVRALVSKDADINATNKANRTAFILARDNHIEGTISYLKSVMEHRNPTRISSKYIGGRRRSKTRRGKKAYRRKRTCKKN